MFSNLKMMFYQSKIIGKAYDIYYTNNKHYPLMVRTYLVFYPDIYYHFKTLKIFHFKDGDELENCITSLEEQGYLPYNYYDSQVSNQDFSYQKKRTANSR